MNPAAQSCVDEATDSNPADGYCPQKPCFGGGERGFTVCCASNKSKSSRRAPQQIAPRRALKVSFSELWKRSALGVFAAQSSKHAKMNVNPIIRDNREDSLSEDARYFASKVELILGTVFSAKIDD